MIFHVLDSVLIGQIPQLHPQLLELWKSQGPACIHYLSQNHLTYFLWMEDCLWSHTPKKHLKKGSVFKYVHTEGNMQVAQSKLKHNTCEYCIAPVCDRPGKSNLNPTLLCSFLFDLRDTSRHPLCSYCNLLRCNISNIRNEQNQVMNRVIYSLFPSTHRYYWHITYKYNR